MFVTDFVSKLVIFIFSNFVDSANIYDISFTTLVLNIVKSREVKESQL